MRTILSTIFAVMLVSTAATAASQEHAMLDNGATFTYSERAFTNTAALVVFVKGGVVRESVKNNGIGSVFARTWVKSSPLLQKIEFYGGSISANAAADYFEFSVTLPTEHWPKVIDDLSDLVLSPTFATNVFIRERALQVEEIEAQQDNPSSLAFRKFMETTYAGSPYALHSEGSIESVSSLEPDDMTTYYQNLMEGVNMTASLVGNIDEPTRNSIRTIMERIPRGSAFDIPCKDTAVRESGREEMFDARIRQSKLYVGYTAPPASHPDYPVLKVVADILGGGMSSRYFNELRKEAGYAYSVGAVYPSRKCSSRLIAFIGTGDDRVEDALSDIQRINDSIGKSITQDELEKVKNYILGKILIESQTNSKRAWYSSFFATLGLGNDYFETYVDIIRNVTTEDIKRVEKIFDEKRTVFVLRPGEDPGEAAAE